MVVPSQPIPPRPVSCLGNSNPRACTDLRRLRDCGGRVMSGRNASAVQQSGSLSMLRRPDAHRRSVAAHIGAVQAAIDAERLAEPGRAAGEVAVAHGTASSLAVADSLICRDGFAVGWAAASSAASAGTAKLPRPPVRCQIQSGSYFACPQQHGFGLAIRLADEVRAEVHAIGEVDVHMARRAKHDGVARSLPAVGMRGRVCRALVGLHFHEPDSNKTLRAVVPKHAAEQLRRDLGRGPTEELARQPGQLGSSAARKHDPESTESPSPSGPPSRCADPVMRHVADRRMPSRRPPDERGDSSPTQRS